MPGGMYPSRPKREFFPISFIGTVLAMAVAMLSNAVWVVNELLCYDAGDGSDAKGAYPTLFLWLS